MQLIHIFIIILSFLILLALVLSIKASNISIKEKGRLAEQKLVSELLDAGFSREDIFADLYIEKHNGSFSQVDALLLTKVGIIIFEVKNYSGWIFGHAKQQNWTQVLNYGRVKNHFYNPIRQNYTHILELKKNVTEFSKLPFYSVIVFYGSSELRDISSSYNNTFIIKSSMVLKTLLYILKHNQTITYNNKDKIVEALKHYIINGQDEKIRNRHSQNIKDMLDNMDNNTFRN